MNGDREIFADGHGWAEAEGQDHLSDDEVTKRLEDAPSPGLWRVLLRPRPPKTRSTGGIMIPTQAQDAESHLQHVGQIVSIGPIAGQSPKFEGAWDYKVGDWIVYGRYVGQRMTHRDIRLLIVDDDQIQARLADPYALKIYAG